LLYPVASVSGYDRPVGSKQLEKRIERLDLLIVDENQYMRKLARIMLMNIGAKSIFEAPDGVVALDMVRSVDPDVMLMDWDLRMLNGPGVVHLLRTPGEFAKPFLPIIALMSRASRSQVREAVRVGVHAVVAMPTSPKILQDHLLSLLINPRPMVQVGNYYVPAPRRSKPTDDSITTAADNRAAEAMPNSVQKVDSEPSWTPLPRRSRQPQFHL
jgi:CheY-like chemotaxis protein